MKRSEEGRVELAGVDVGGLFDAGEARTPAYLYDLDAIALSARSLRAGFDGAPHLVAYALKANSAGPIVRTLAAEGCGADVVSGAELELALACGIAPADVVFSGVAKSDAEIDRALSRGVASIHAESIEEIGRVAARARATSHPAALSLRFNPEVEADTHAYIATGHDEAKFGIPAADVPACLDVLRSAPEVTLVGLSSHVGSQLKHTADYVAAAEKLLELARAVEAQQGAPLRLLDFGGGFGIDYGDGCPTTPADFAAALVALLRARGRTDVRAIVEPGRSLVAAHGVLCATVIQTKHARFAEHARDYLLIDAGMNDLLRPALYQARHRVEPMDAPPPAAPHGIEMRVCGPVCESSDDFGTHRMPERAPARVVLRDAGAYGFTMASEYNGRALPSEVFLSRGRVVARLAPRSADAWVAARLGD